ncbi:hypothetical protein [Reyranella sp.]|uniref:hypothetical protein n=1 Tax=Reyranella sp. TaxID=1929291 RepID=UPI0027310BCE|nr:hypothetical protein [Reyranella sp.]MDP2376565.1 hypothetical protein [Reyranella sp.]
MTAPRRLTGAGLTAAIDALKTRLQVATDWDLAVLLGLHGSAVSQWRQRDAMPAWAAQMITAPQAACSSAIDRAAQQIRLAAALAAASPTTTERADRLTADTPVSAAKHFDPVGPAGAA